MGSRSLLGEMVDRVFGGQRDAPLPQLFDHRQLTSQEQLLPKKILREAQP
jgi:flagellar motor switch protein FliM